MISKKQLNEVLKEYFEFTLPSYGLNWFDAERIARIYMLLEKHDSSKRYFLCAAKKKEEVDAKIETREPHYVFYTSSLHVGLLYYYASEHSKALELFIRVKEDILNDFAPIGGKKSKRNHQLSALVLAYLLLEENKAAAEIMTEIRKIDPDEIGMLEGEKLDAIEKVIHACNNDDLETASSALQQYQKKLVNIDSDPMSTGTINYFDVLMLLERACSRIGKNPSNLL